MYNIKLYDYVPKPKPATGDYIVCAHYYAAWQKGSALLHDGFDDLRDYPDRTPLAGYYDEGDPSYADWEIKWALEHGINCFIHCWYRFKDNVGKPVTRQALRCGHAIHEGFFNAKYEQMMKFAIMFEVSPRWGSTTPTDMIENVMPFWMENYFKRGNYLIIDNKPVVFIYAWRELAKAFKSPEEQKQVFELCGDYCRAHGFDGIIFSAQEDTIDDETHPELVARGFDFMFAYNTYIKREENPPEDDLIREITEKYQSTVAYDPSRFVTTASCFWDPEPRKTQKWLDMGVFYSQWGSVWYLQPENYRKLLRNLKEITDSLPENNIGRKIIMIDNWNEWDEGHFVAPTHRFGFGYLQAIREELTHRDNLPDYRLPQDIGLSNFNREWGEPDLLEKCREKYGVK